MTLMRLITSACPVLDKVIGYEGEHFTHRIFTQYPDNCPSPRQIYDFMTDNDFHIETDDVKEYYGNLAHFYEHMDRCDTLLAIGGLAAECIVDLPVAFDNTGLSDAYRSEASHE